MYQETLASDILFYKLEKFQKKLIYYDSLIITFSKK